MFSYIVSYNHALVPAFELNLSSVLFASAAPAASFDGELSLEDIVGNGAFILRYKAGDLGSALVSDDKSTVTLKEVPNDTYLVVQNSAGAYAKKITSGMTSVSANDINSQLTSFDNCKVWLEKTDTSANMTYATLAEYSVNIIAGAGVNIASNNGMQEVAVSEAISEIIVEAADGHYLPDDYIQKIQGLNGLTATLYDTKNGFTITGTPTSNVNITLPAATKKTERFDTPGVTGGIGSTINGTDTTMEYANSETPDTWTECTDKNTEVAAGTYYVRYKETRTQKAGPSTQVEVIAPTYTISVDIDSLVFDTLNEGYKNSPSAQSVTITNTGNSKVTLETPASSNYTVNLSGNEIDPGGQVTLTVVPNANLTSGTYNETIEIKTAQNTSANINVSFKVNGALQVSLNATETNIVEGQSATLTAKVQGGSGSYSYTWFEGNVENGNLQGNEVTVFPTVTTNYKVVVTDTIEDKSATATITVVPKKYDLTVPDVFNFADQCAGYEDVSANPFSIRNTGNVEVTNINAALAGTNSDVFTLDTSGMQDTLAPGATMVFTVKPNAGLGAGAYTAELQITGEIGITRTVPIGFTVNDHDYESVVTAPTCTSKGYTTHTCRFCKDFYTDSETEMLMHECGEEWKSDETSHWHECKNCNGRSEEAEHTFQWITDKEPTETETGSKHEECSVCGYKKAGVEIPVVKPSDPDKPNPDKPNKDKPDTNKPDNDTGSPATGDQTNVGFYIFLFITSALCIVLGVWEKKRTLENR